ncbi:Protein of uncharacterised function, DUF484 [Klebsiella michiganensis]|uniref:Protein of uncharacterized function, DUF484 n=1 Tax=Klebsiella michiganensis TaxID=1134687 RepID=A0A7H4M2I3_9ENTR|nr:Protein of uncharacterised function, DUF484 [Klebsiella michiganensis]
MARARNHINVLEENMTLLMAQATANESLFQRCLISRRGWRRPIALMKC